MGTAELAKVIGHQLRVRILYELVRGRCPVSELMVRLDVEASLLSKHLAILRSAGLVGCDVDWRCRRYYLRDPEVVKMILYALEEGVKRSGK